MSTPATPTSPSAWATLDASAARAKLAEVLASAATEPTVITRYGQPVGVVVSYDFFERAVEALEDLADIAASEAAETESADRIPWDQVKADLGWA